MNSTNKNEMPFGKQNYYLIGIAVACIILGFVLMQLETAQYGFGFLGLTLGPLMVLIGFGVGFAAIFYRPKS